jgi:hypothetical protein
MCDGPDLLDWITTCKAQIFNHLNRQSNSCNGANVWQAIRLGYSPPSSPSRGESLTSIP